MTLVEYNINCEWTLIYPIICGIDCYNLFILVPKETESSIEKSLNKGSYIFMCYAHVCMKKKHRRHT